jgi:threonine synthase
MNFIQTRGNDDSKAKYVTFSEAILSPIASFGGLYVPQELPKLGEEFLKKHINSTYKELALDMLLSFEIDIEDSVIAEALSLYDRFDDPLNPVPVVKIKDNLYVSELYHGPTRAFKDMALQPFGKILSSVAQKRGENYLILAATSGDTGPAALETFKNQKNIQVVCMYPANGTSDVQRLQMVTEDAENLKVIGIKGNFDDAQSALKNLLASPSFNKTLDDKNISLSAAKSVNFGRIIFQIVYHIHNYLELVRQDVISIGERVYLNVPSGNFGNVLGGFYAQEMGLPVEKLVISSNENNILTRLIQTGIYDIRDTDLKLTTSPAMDILKSSNVERILYSLYGATRTRELMNDLDTKKIYTFTKDELLKLKEVLKADFCRYEEGKEYI